MAKHARRHARSHLRGYRLTAIEDGNYRTDDSRWSDMVYGPGSILLFEPGERPRWQASVGTIETSIVFHFPFADSHQQGSLWGRPLPAVLDDHQIERCQPRLKAITSLWWHDTVRQIRANSLLGLLLADLVGSEENPHFREVTQANDQRIRLAIEMARARLNSWTVRDMAESVAMHRSAFSRLFVKETGENPNQWLDKARLSYAQVRLAEPGVAMKYIGECVGHPTPQSFSRWFKQKTGQTPGSWRRKCCPE